MARKRPRQSACGASDISADGNRLGWYVVMSWKRGANSFVTYQLRTGHAAGDNASRISRLTAATSRQGFGRESLPPGSINNRYVPEKPMSAGGEFVRLAAGDEGTRAPSNSPGCEPRRPAGRSGHQVRVRDQPENREDARHHS